MNSPLPRSTPEAQGISSSSILNFVNAVEKQVHDLHSFMLLRHGAVAAEGWWSPYGPNYRHMLFSLSKSFTSSAIGLLVAEGRLSINDPVISFFPDDLPAEVSENLAALRVRQLLAMSTGHGDDTMSAMHEREDGNWVRAFLELPVAHKPGTHFLYNTGATYMLSAIVQKVSGAMLLDYLKPRLLEPLGIENATWEVSPQGIHTGGYGLNITTEDIAKFGQLYLNKGLWQGKRILSEAWIEEASARQTSNGGSPESDWEQGYGYQFWRCRHEAFRGDGAFGQYCIVMPQQDAVLAITGGLDDMQMPLNIVWEHLLPAMSADVLPDAPQAQAELARKLASLTLPPPSGPSASPLAAGISGRSYTIDANEQGVESIELHFEENCCRVTTITPVGEVPVIGGYGVWHEGTTTLPTGIDSRYAASGVWTAEDTFTLTTRFYETPFVQTSAFHFADHQVKVDMELNVAFGPRTFTLTGHSS